MIAFHHLLVGGNSVEQPKHRERATIALSHADKIAGFARFHRPFHRASTAFHRGVWLSPPYPLSGGGRWKMRWKALPFHHRLLIVQLLLSVCEHSPASTLSAPYGRR
jgi:hypothetical protein